MKRQYLQDYGMELLVAGVQEKCVAEVKQCDINRAKTFLLSLPTLKFTLQCREKVKLYLTKYGKWT